MARIEWKPEFSVGDPAVDHEHRELIDLVNATAGAVLEGGNEDEVAQGFGELYRAISAHFALEERQMREAGYDQLPQHKGDHERLLDVLRDLMDDPRQAGAIRRSERRAVAPGEFVHHAAVGRDEHELVVAIGQAHASVDIVNRHTAVDRCVAVAPEHDVAAGRKEQIPGNHVAVAAAVGQRPPAQVDCTRGGIEEFDPLTVAIGRCRRVDHHFAQLDRRRWAGCW